MPTTLITPAAAEPVTLVEAKLHCRVDDEFDDTYVSSLIKAARQWCENFTKRQFITATWQLTLDRFRSTIRLPYPTLQVVNSIQYKDVNGNTQTVDVADYIVDTDSEPGRVTPARNITWPVTDTTINSVTINYDSGYGSNASDVPESIKQAMLILISDWYNFRESVVVSSVNKVPMAVESLLSPHVIREFH